MSQSSTKGEGTKDGGQESKTDESLGLSATEPPQDACINLSGLPEDVLLQVFSYLGVKEHFLLTVMSSSLLKAVEEFSKRSLEELKEKHSMDDTWEDRIRAPPSSIETTIQDQLELPYRYLLWRAQRTPFYTLGDANEHSVNVYWGLEALPHGHRLLSLGNDGIVQVWDLSTKKDPIVLDGTNGTQAIFLLGDYIVVNTFVHGSICVYSLDGDLIHNVEAQLRMIAFLIATGEGKVFFPYNGDGQFIAILDLVTGHVRQQEVPWREGTDLDSIDSFHVCGSELLALEAGTGIHVFDVGDISLKDFFAGDYHHVAKAMDEPNTVIATTESTLDVLTLENGRLISLCARTFAPVPIRIACPSIVGVYQMPFLFRYPGPKEILAQDHFCVQHFQRKVGADMQVPDTSHVCLHERT